MLSFRTKFERPQGISQRGWRDIAKSGMLAVGTAWDRLFKMLHFGPDAARRYNYVPRTAAYKRRRLRIHGVPLSVDLRWSGRTLADVRRRQAPRPFPSRVTIDMPTPAYVRMRPLPVGQAWVDKLGRRRFRKKEGPALGEELTRLAGHCQERHVGGRDGLGPAVQDAAFRGRCGAAVQLCAADGSL